MAQNLVSVQEIENLEPKASPMLEAKGLDSTWIVTGSRPHSKAEGSMPARDRSRNEEATASVEGGHAEGRPGEGADVAHEATGKGAGDSVKAAHWALSTRVHAFL